jgi:hypothetical protein
MAQTVTLSSGTSQGPKALFAVHEAAEGHATSGSAGAA